MDHKTSINDMVHVEKDTLTFDEPMATHIDFSKFLMNRLKLDKITKVELVRPVYKLLKGTCQSSIRLEYNMKECYKALSDQLDFANPEGDRCSFDFSKPLPLKGPPVHLTVVEFFFNNDLEYLNQQAWKEVHYVNYQTKAARYKLVVRAKVNKQFGYGYLEEIVVRRADRKLYTFKEGDFINLHLNDIEDMLLLVIQHKLFHLNGDATVDLAVILRYNKGMPRRKWTDSDQRWSSVMVNLIDKQLLERRIKRIWKDWLV
uniref:Uncharacterized protein n=1 Tax=Tanacetum cinerariifolium TaxID=118510 RepID=A0A699K637_TANCI|nr:hypothetical protein [Tanacetum cinerariifolium]